MTTGRNPVRYAFLYLLVFPALLALCGSAARGAPSIEVQIGFNGHVVPERYAPLRVRVHGYDGAGDAQVVVTQQLGNEWRDTATVRQELDLVVASDGSYTTVLPIYEPLNPISVALIDEAGRTVAETSVNLRETRHLADFSLLYGSLPYSIGDDVTQVAAVDLPSSWWAFDAIRSFWISAPLPQEAWPAIARWVLSGGSVVLASGPDYFRYDSPDLREILPLDDPAIGTLPDGLLYLSGTLKPGASVALSREDVPLLVDWSYGAGHLAVMALRPVDLTEAEFTRIAETLPGSTRISMTPVSETLLGGLPVARPTHLAVLLLIAACVVGLVVVTTVARRHRWPGTIAAVCVFAGLSGWSGFLGNSSNTISTVYAINTSLHVIESFGIEIDSLSFYCSDAGRHAYALASETIPAQAPPSRLAEHPIYTFMPRPTATPWVYEHIASPGGVLTSAAEIGQKTFYSYASSPSLLRLTYDPTDALATLDNQAEEQLVDGWLVVDGQGVRVRQVSRGTQTVRLQAEGTLAALFGQAADPAPFVLQHLAEELPLQHGVWFIALSALEDVPSQQPGQEVRHLGVYVVKGGVS